MQAILADVSWVVVLVATAVSFLLGWLWYSPFLFVEAWKKGIGSPAVPNRPMMPIMVVQLVATFLFSWAIAAALESSMALAILVAVSTAALLKAGGLFNGKSMAAVAVESSYVLVQAAIVILTAQILS